MGQLPECWEIHREIPPHHLPQPSAHTHPLPTSPLSPHKGKPHYWRRILQPDHKCSPVNCYYPDKSRQAEETIQLPVRFWEKGQSKHMKKHMKKFSQHVKSSRARAHMSHTQSNDLHPQLTLHHCGALPQGLIRNIYACELIFNNLFT